MDNAVILIVDDMADTLAMLNDALDHEGFSVLVALGGNQALSICKRIVPDLILMDAIMPGMSGFECCKALRADPRLSHIPVVFMTGLDSNDTVMKSFESGAIDYIQKPVRLEELCARIRGHIQRARQLAQSYTMLDSCGKPSLSCDDKGRVLWQTATAASLLNETELSRIDIQAKLAQFLPEAETGAKLPLSHGICLKLEGKSEEGYVLEIKKELDDDQAAEILQKAFGLTSREAQVLYWVSLGKSNKDLGIILNISPRTVNKHLESIFEKLLTENRTAAASMAIKALQKA